jgi:hypothetical protein
MAYIYAGVRRLVGQPLYGDGNCALMVQHFAQLPRHDHWRQGAHVVEQANIWPGTAIATFENGRYPNNPHNNHVAFFFKFGRRNPDGTWASIFIVEQFKGNGGLPGSGVIQLREIPAKGKVDPKYGDRWKDPSNNADAFSIIE